MLTLRFDEIDDPAFDLDTARIESGRFILDGWIDSAGAGTRRRPLGKHVIRLVATMVDSYSETDDAGVRALIPESIDIAEHQVHFVGVIPVTLTLSTSGRSVVSFEVDEAPFAERGRLRWIPV